MANKHHHTYLRGVSTKNGGLRKLYLDQRSANRVRKSADILSKPNAVGDYWIVSPDDKEFWTQSLQMHFVKIPPGGKKAGHGHQNEALFYILEGRGHEAHDGIVYDWDKDDFVIVHPDSVHTHYNDSAEKQAIAIVAKGKSVWMALGLIQQPRYSDAYAKIDKEKFAPLNRWHDILTPDCEKLKKIIKPEDNAWVYTDNDRFTKTIASPETANLRLYGVDAYMQKIEAKKSTAPHWHMADEIIYVLHGSGKSLHWEVEAEIKDQYEAYIAKTPTMWHIEKGDFLYIPTNTAHQHINTSTTENLIMLSWQNRAFKLMGYDSTVYLNI